MENLPGLEYAIAIRMTCSNPDLAGQPRPAALPSVRTEDRTPQQEAALSLPAGATPDAVVAAVADFIRRTGQVPETVHVQGAGLFTIGRTPAPGAPVRRLEGCVAIITGSAQGFGRGIAEELAREGARIVVADINDAVGDSFAAELRQSHGKESAIYCHMDVANLGSVEAGVALAVRTFGGVDMFVANAGVLKAGALDEMDEAAFDLVTRVNYKAYFLGAKAVAPVMKIQHRFNPHHFMDIVQINSKSGLEGSNKNFAYAGSKFGSIGLTQSFALELVPFHIKVNAICPGNYFDGPLWSDPEKGLFVQYLRTGKVPGAKTIEDVKKSYLSKVPMQRGCLPSDVARAILYVHDQHYETGQAIPVTGGQVMLN
jgi:NAD(P)-dependent dehydrogenase (short-subunit alcohol dehydrogenase family)